MADWQITGNYFENCNCEAVCPCLFLSPPTEGECTAFLAWHIDEGHSGDVDLGGLDVALALHAPGLLVDGNWRVALYIDESASAAQMEAVVPIFAGQAGGHFEVLASFIGEVVGVKQVRIEFTADGRKRSLRIPDVGAMEIEGMEGADGAEVTIANTPLFVVPEAPGIVAKSTTAMQLDDQGLAWSVPAGRAGLYAAFSYSGA
jgi:hypothetical protein